MAAIIPAIIPQSAETLMRDLGRVSFAPRIQIDVVDGLLAQPASWPYRPLGAVLPTASLLKPFQVMVDLMVEDVMGAARVWLGAGARELVVHHESGVTSDQLVLIKEMGVQTLYFAADDDVPLETYLKLLPYVDGFQLMGIDVMGQQGQPFSTRVLDNVRALREVTSLPIVIDGSVNAATIEPLRDAGATDFVVGSAILAQADPYAAYRTLFELANHS